VLYSGFAALGGWLAAAALRRRRPGEPPGRWVPAGYGLGLLGVGVFLAGGIGDMIWHQIFGIEVGLDALLSPTHLVLLVGGVLMLTTPLRATVARHRTLPASAWAGLPAILALSVTAAVAAFFLSYLSVFADAATIPPTRIPEGAPGHRQAENFTIVGIGEYLTTTAILVIAVLFVYRLGRRLPAGLISAVVTTVVLGAGVMTEFAHPAALLGAVLGGAAADVVVQTLTTRVPRWTPVAVGVILPALVWPGHLAGLAVSTRVAWTVELWTGIVVLTALAGAMIGALLPPSDYVTDQPSKRRYPHGFADAASGRLRSTPTTLRADGLNPGVWFRC
jgi:hypothetical protein